MKKVLIKEEMLSCLEEKEIQKIAYNLMFAKEQKEIVLFTSYTKEEGKTTIALKTGMELAKDGKKVLYVGFEEVPFADGEQEKEVIVKTNIIGFDILLKKIFNNDYVNYKETYDYILVDAPAMSETKVGVFFANSSDLVLLVVETNRNCYKDILECKQDILISGCKDIRVVLNKTREIYGVLKKTKNVKRKR